MSDRIVRYVVVRGRVQGVGYRAFVAEDVPYGAWIVQPLHRGPKMRRDMSSKIMVEHRRLLR